MNIIMAGMDHSMAGIDLRERFSFTKPKQEAICEALRAMEGVRGAVLLSTCNRTELYLSLDPYKECDPFLKLCKAAGLDVTPSKHCYRILKGREAFWHLCRLACGLESQILGEDQIITQVKEAVALARGCGAADSNLEVVFRTAITAAKKIKTVVKFSKAENSVALKTLAILRQELKVKSPGRILVIGNGEVGRLVANTLVQHGFEVAMTLRQYKYRDIEIPEGVTAFDYGERYQRLGTFDAVISATASPHHTLAIEPLKDMASLPGIMIDLAVPRDIDLEIGRQRPVKLYDIDSIAEGAIEQSNQLQFQQAEDIIHKYHGDLMKWHHYKERVSG